MPVATFDEALSDVLATSTTEWLQQEKELAKTMTRQSALSLWNKSEDEGTYLTGLEGGAILSILREIQRTERTPDEHEAIMMIRAWLWELNQAAGVVQMNSKTMSLKKTPPLRKALARI